MAIENRNALAGGQTLVARYKGADHKVLVLEDDKGGFGLELDKGTIYKSLSSAGSAVTGGTACNGWRFWSFEGEAPSAKGPKPRAAKKEPKSKVIKNLKRLPGKKGVPEGHSRWFCSCCQSGFDATDSKEPEHCPEGHPMVVEDEFAVSGK